MRYVMFSCDFHLLQYWKNVCLFLTQLSLVTFTGNLIIGTRLVDSWKDNGQSLLAALLNKSSTDVTVLYDDVLLVLRGIAGMVCIKSTINYSSGCVDRWKLRLKHIVLFIITVSIALFLVQVFHRMTGISVLELVHLRMRLYGLYFVLQCSCIPSSHLVASFPAHMHDSLIADCKGSLQYMCQGYLINDVCFLR